MKITTGLLITLMVISNPPSAWAKSQNDLTAKPGQVTLELGAEQFQFQILNCAITEPAEADPRTEVDVYAHGHFRGEPAIIALTKSSPGGHLFQHLEIWLTQLSADDMQLKRYEYLKKKQKETDDWYLPLYQAIETKYPIDNSMDFETINKVMNQRNEETDALNQERDKRQLSWSLNHGTVDVEVAQQIARFNTTGITYAGQNATPKAFIGTDKLPVKLVAQCQ